jgi:hypothetical protein
MIPIGDFEILAKPVDRPRLPFKIRLLLFPNLCGLRDLLVQNPSLCALCERLSLLEHPLVVLKPIDRSLHRLANSQFRAPAGSAYFRSI